MNILTYKDLPKHNATLKNLDFPSISVIKDFSPKHELFKRLSDFISNDELRPAMMGVYYDGTGENSAIVATDANVIIHIPVKDTVETQIYTSDIKTKKVTTIEGVYPKYRAVIPTTFVYEGSLDIKKLYIITKQYINTIPKKDISHANCTISLRFSLDGQDYYHAFFAPYLLKILRYYLSQNILKGKIFFSSLGGNRAAIISPEEFFEFRQKKYHTITGKDIARNIDAIPFCLIMPVIIEQVYDNNMPYFVYDDYILFEFGSSIIYDVDTQKAYDGKNYIDIEIAENTPEKEYNLPEGLWKVIKSLSLISAGEKKTYPTNIVYFYKKGKSFDLFVGMGVTIGNMPDGWLKIKNVKWKGDEGFHMIAGDGFIKVVQKERWVKPEIHSAGNLSMEKFEKFPSGIFDIIKASNFDYLSKVYFLFDKLLYIIINEWSDKLAIATKTSNNKCNCVLSFIECLSIKSFINWVYDYNLEPSIRFDNVDGRTVISMKLKDYDFEFISTSYNIDYELKDLPSAYFKKQWEYDLTINTDKIKKFIPKTVAKKQEGLFIDDKNDVLIVSDNNDNTVKNAGFFTQSSGETTNGMLINLVANYNAEKNGIVLVSDRYQSVLRITDIIDIFGQNDIKVKVIPKTGIYITYQEIEKLLKQKGFDGELIEAYYEIPQKEVTPEVIPDNAVNIFYGTMKSKLQHLLTLL